MILVSHIRQFVFCPRILYFYTFCDIKPVYPEYVNSGSQYHNKQNELFKNRKFIKFKLPIIKAHSNLYLQDSSMQGVADLVLECQNEIIVAEFKNQTKPILNKGTKMQLIAYSKLASKHFNKPFFKIMLICSNNLKFKIFNVKSDDLAQFNSTIDKINKMLNQEPFPQSCASIAACMQCEFKNYCDDRE